MAASKHLVTRSDVVTRLRIDSWNLNGMPRKQHQTSRSTASRSPRR
jgi:hypothetical protein